MIGNTSLERLIVQMADIQNRLTRIEEEVKELRQDKLDETVLKILKWGEL